MTTDSVLFRRSGGLTGEISPPADKSIAHRAALFAAMAEGETRITNYLEAEDTLSTLDAIERLGAKVERVEPGEGEGPGAPGSGTEIRVTGIGLDGPARAAGSAPVAIDCGNAGTLIRLISGWLAGQSGGSWTLSGDESLRSRPMGRIISPLEEMGASVAGDQGCAPLSIEGRPLQGIEYLSPVASAQVKSCLILAALQASGPTLIEEPVASRDHTELMLRAMGAPVDVEGGRRVRIEPLDQPLQPIDIEVPADFSSAAFFLVAATLVNHSDLTLRGVGMNPRRAGLISVMKRMGAQIEIEPRAGGPDGDPVADLRVRTAPVLVGTQIGAAEVPSMIDELPLVALLGVFADGATELTGARELRHKESDRIRTVVEGLWDLGAQIEEEPDGFTVIGNGDLGGGSINSHGDHRIAMLGAIAGLASKQGATVQGMAVAAVSYPNFIADLDRVSGQESDPA